MYKIATIEGKGKGLVATCTIKRGQIVLHDTGISSKLETPFDYDRANARVAEQMLREYRSMTEVLHTGPMTLSIPDSPCPPGIQSDKWAKGIHQVHVNSFCFGEMVILFFTLSFINHSCAPNVKIDPPPLEPTGMYRLVATRDIAAGEELTLVYNWMVDAQPLAARQSFFQKHFGFECRCEICVNEPRVVAEMDELIRAGNVFRYDVATEVKENNDRE